MKDVLKMFTLPVDKTPVLLLLLGALMIIGAICISVTYANKIGVIDTPKTQEGLGMALVGVLSVTFLIAVGN